MHAFRDRSNIIRKMRRKTKARCLKREDAFTILFCLMNPTGPGGHLLESLRCHVDKRGIRERHTREGLAVVGKRGMDRAVLGRYGAIASLERCFLSESSESFDISLLLAECMSRWLTKNDFTS
jgi:hypothetical protein